MTPEVGALFVKALQVAREHVPTDPDGPAGPPCEPRPRTVTPVAPRGDVPRAGGPQSGAATIQIVVNVDAEVLADDADGICEPAVPRWRPRRCAGWRATRRSSMPRAPPSIGPGTARHSRARRVGPSTARSRLSIPGCGRRVRAVHHLRHRARRRQRPVQPRRAVLVPPPARPRRRLERPIRRRRQRRSDPARRRGAAVCPPPSPTDGGAVERANRSLGLQIGPRTCVPRWYGDPLRLPDVVDALLFARKHANEPFGGAEG